MKISHKITNIIIKNKFSSIDNPTLKNIDNQMQLHLKIPKTSFNQRFHASSEEVLIQKTICDSLYDEQFQKNSYFKVFKIFDSPFPVYRELHFGHFYNKTLKDIANRYQLLQGAKIDYTLGYQTHGSIIENEVYDANIHLNDIELRQKCKQYVEQKIQEYNQQMKRWGLLSNFHQQYLTSDPKFEQNVISFFNQLVSKNLIYRDNRPILWSSSQHKSVSEDEIEQKFVTKKGYFIKFKVSHTNQNELSSFQNLNLIIFTTEPWTLSAAQGVTINSKQTYVIFDFDNEQYVMAHERYLFYRQNLKINGAQFIKKLQGDELLGLTVQLPIFNREIPILNNDEMKTYYGSGIISLCPAHYLDDLKLALHYGLDKQGYVDDKCRIQQTNTLIDGLDVVTEQANIKIMDLMIDEQRVLNLSENFQTCQHFHKDSKEQVIVRTQSHWYCKIFEKDKEDFFDQHVKIIQNHSPDSVFGDYKTFIAERQNGWCISSYNVWGTPIPVFKYKKINKYLIKSQIVTHILKLFTEHGSDIWYTWNIQDLLPQKYKHEAEQLEKCREVFDVLFSNGCVQIYNEQIEKSITQQNQSLEAMIIEGKDQNDGWLQSMALVSILNNQVKPYQVEKIHAVVMDSKQQKLSKFSDQTKSLNDLIYGTVKLNDQRQYGYGVDVLRLWVASSDQINDDQDFIPLSSLDIEQANKEIKILRKTYWELLRFLEGFNQRVDGFESFFNKFIYDQLILYIISMKKAYEQYDFQKCYKLTIDFMKFYVQDIFIDSTKQQIISNFLDSQETLYLYQQILENTLIAISPILPHNSQQIYHNYKQSSLTIFHQRWPDISQNQIIDSAKSIPFYDFLLDIRNQISEIINQNKNRLKKSKTPYDLKLIFTQDQINIFQTLNRIDLKSLSQIFSVNSTTLQLNEDQQEQLYNNHEIIISSFKIKTNFKNKKTLIQSKLLQVSEYQCPRCGLPKSFQKDQICLNCQNYLNKNQLKLK